MTIVTLKNVIKIKKLNYVKSKLFKLNIKFEHDYFFHIQVGDEGENHHKVDDHHRKEKSAGGFFSVLRRGSH